MKQIDYLKLVATGRKSVHYQRPSDADSALTGFIGFGLIISLILTFGIAVLVSYLGGVMDADKVGLAIAATAVPGIAFLLSSIFIGGAPTLVRYVIVAVGATAVVALTWSMLTGAFSPWYLLVPAFLYSLLVSVGALRQL